MEKLKKVRTTDQSFANHKHNPMLFFSILTENYGNCNSLSYLPR